MIKTSLTEIFFVIINTHISLILNIVSMLEFIKNIILRQRTKIVGSWREGDFQSGTLSSPLKET